MTWTMEKWLSGVFLTQATVAEIEQLTEHFRLIALEGKGLCKPDFRPGDKLQIRVAPWKLRTYTPFDWDHNLGRIQVLAFVHAGGPGSAWAAALRPGERVEIFGPRTSIPLSDLGDRAALFGDETSIGVARILRAIRPRASAVLESSFPAESEAVLARLGVENVTVVARAPDDSHLHAVRDQLLPAAREPGPPPLVLTGRAQSIQALRSLFDPPGRRSVARSKAYWAVGKAGLD
jgi:ferric-chelate reductase (NADPH)